MKALKQQRGYLLITVVVTLFLLATVATMLAYESAHNAHDANSELEAARADFVARAGMQNALWLAQNNACMGEFTIPLTSLGKDGFDATARGPGAGTKYTLTADQDAWIRNDDPGRNNGDTTSNHIRFESGNTEQILTRFDVSSIPSGTRVRSAIAWFHIKALKPHPEGAISIHEVLADWTEGDVTWESFGGAYDNSIIGSIPAQDAGDVWVAINLTGLVQAWVNGTPNHGILFNTQAEGIHTEYTAREDGANPPRLEVVTGGDPGSSVSIKAKASLANGNGRVTKEKAAIAYQPPITTTLQLGADAGEDVTTDSFYSARNYGGATYVQVNDNGTDWQQYPLIRFDLAGLPAGALVRSAQLELHMRDINAPGTATIHQVTRSWVEGTKSGGGTADGASWFTYDGNNTWASAGGDFNPAVVAETAIDGSETTVNWEIGPLVQRWLAGEPNHGLMIRPANGLREAEFSSKEDSGIGIQPKLTIEYACECGGACMSQTGSGNILMVVGDMNAPGAGDLISKSYLEAWGYTVKLIADQANSNAYEAEFLNSDVIYVSESVDAIALSNKLDAAPLPIVSADGDLNDRLGMSTTKGTPIGHALDVIDTDHFITRIFPAGTLKLKTVDTELVSATGSKSTDAQVLATVDGQDSLVALDAGGISTKGGTVSTRRVLLPVGDSDVSWGYLTNNGQLIVQRAIAWAMGAGKTTVDLNVLLVVGDAASPLTSDLDRKALIESWGHTVTLIDDGDSQANFDDAVATNDVVYIAGSGSSADVGTKLTAATVGVLSEDIGLVDELGIAEPSFVKRNSQSINVINNSHYLTSGFGLGTLQLYSYVPGIWTVSGSLAPGLQVLGEAQESGSPYPPGLAILEAGAELWGGGSAAGRRVQVPWSEGSFDINSLNADGQSIFQRALEWGAGAGAGACASTSPLLFVVGDATTPSSQETARRTLLVSWCYSVTLIDDGDSQANFDTAASNADVAYISSEVSASALGTKLKNNPIGIVNEDPDLHNDYGFSTVRYRSTTNAPLSTDSAHYITSPFGGADITLFDSTQPAGAAVGTLPSGLETIGSWTSGDLAPLGGLMTLDTGAAISGGGTATGRRVQIPWDGDEGGAVADIGALTADGKTVLQRSLEWAAGLDTGPIAHWKLDETGGTTAIDSEGGHDGTLVNGPNWQPGYLDGALEFDGSNDHILVPHDDALSLSAFSISAWINADTVSGNRSIVYKGASNAEANYHLHIDDGEVSLGLTDSGWMYYILSTNANMVAGRWYHLATTFDGATGEGKHYLDGTLIHTGTIGPSPIANTGPIFIGTDPFDDHWDGLLDDVRIYDTVLGPSEIAELATIGGGGGGGNGSGEGVVFESYADAARPSGTTSIDVPKPGGTATGDLLIAALATDGDSASSFSPPAGWTPVSVGTSANNRVSFGVWWKIATSSEPSQYNFTWSGSEEAYGWVSRFTGHDPTSPIIYDNGTLTNDSTSAPICQRLVTTEDNVMILRLGGFDDDDVNIGSPGLDGHTAINMGESGGGAGTASGGSGYFIQTAAGDSDFGYFQLTNNEEMRTVTLGIRPAP